MPTRDILTPDFESPERKSPAVVAIFNLCATIVGGGVLSLPLAFSKCGVVLGTVLMVVGGIVTERSLYLLCICARITGATTYGEVGKAAFGKYMEYFISLVLFVFLMFVLVGYMVLVQDIWSSNVEIVFQLESPPNAQWILFGVLLLMSPFFIQKSLHSLRYNCYVGFASVSMLCLALCHHALTTPLPSPLLLWSTSFEDILFSFPIIILSFLSIFNVLPIQGSLIEPSRGRMLLVIDGAVGSCFLLMLIFGLAGYLYAGASTDGNILRNASLHADWMFLIGRFGCGLTIVLAMAMMLLPCRASLLEVLDVFVNGPHIVPMEVILSEETSLLQAEKGRPDIQHVIQRSTLMDNTLIHYFTTTAIAVVCYLAAGRVPGVAFVWSLCGSFLAFLIAFLLPAACYLEIQRSHPSAVEKSPSWTVFSWFLIVASVISSVACTTQTILNLA